MHHHMENPALIVLLIILALIGVISLWHIGVSKHHLFSAMKEVSFIYLFSNLPLIILICFQHSSTKDSPLDILIQFFNDGDVFIYTSALIAPVFWLIVAYSKDNFRATNGFLLIVALLIIIFSSVLFGNSTISNTVPINTLNEGYLTLYLCSIFLWIFSVIYKRFLDAFDNEPQKNNVLENLEARK